MNHRTRLPFAPIEREVAAGFRPASSQELDTCTAGYVARRLHTSREVVYKWRRTGLTVAAADRLACHLNLHPAILWPEEWSEAA
jgi:hypothetical protein